MGVTIDAFERRVVRSLEMTILACRPDARRMPVSSSDGEVRAMRKKRRGLPREGAMTHCAFGGKTGGFMIGILRASVLVEMTADALGRCSAEMIVGVTSETIDRFMRPPCRELRPIVIETLQPRHRLFAMTLHTVGAESFSAMVDRGGRIVVLPVTCEALDGSLRETK